LPFGISPATSSESRPAPTLVATARQEPRRSESMRRATKSPPFWRGTSSWVYDNTSVDASHSLVFEARNGEICFIAGDAPSWLTATLVLKSHPYLVNIDQLIIHSRLISFRPPFVVQAIPVRV